MDKLRSVSGRAYPWGAKNIDTDVIIPAAYLKTISREGLGKGAFEAVRAQPGNLFDDPLYAGAPILLAGDNFGCGSSREHAAWALLDMGLRVVIAPSFSDIFSGNAVKNGILPLVLPVETVDRLIEAARDGGELTVDLERCTVTGGNERFAFEIDAFRRECLLEGLDEVGLTIRQGDEIAAYETSHRDGQPWLYSARLDAAA